MAAVLGSDYDASEIVERLGNIRVRMLQIGAAGVLIAIIILNLIVRTITRSLWTVNKRFMNWYITKGI